jgi:hypothetical protein
MPIISGGKIIEGVGRGYSSSGAPSAGTSEVQTLTFGGTPTGGTFVLAFEGMATAPITWSSTNATLVSNIDTALEALPNIGTGEVTTAVGTMTAGIGTITCTFSGNYGVRPLSVMTVVTNSMTGTAPTLTITRSTPGVAPSGAGAAKGAMLVREDTGVLYVNTGTALAPTWTVVGTQT